MDHKNVMQEVIISKVVINIGTGSNDQMQLGARKLIETITGRKPADELSRTRNPSFRIAKGQKIGAFVTVRGEDAKRLAKRLFDAVDNKVKLESVTSNSLSFGIPEYIDISGVKYDPSVGMLGMNVNVSFKRRGIRVAQKKIKRAKIPARHRMVTREEILDYIKDEFNVKQIEQVS
ncbi:MAG: 50S ribosomal protein L5 [Candidatus Micrarchaeota archaeon]|nr:50S ribosomal protein L5 [Candidatus Micrarchaeota archaeon]